MTDASLKEMQAICRIAETGSFAQAADDLALTPSAVSKLVNRLESRLGIRLITRTTRRLSLTSEGATYVARARDILNAVEDVEQEVMASAAEPSGVLRVNTGTAFGRHVLGPIVPDFLARYPKIRLDIGIADRQVDLIAEQWDVAIRMGQPGDLSLVIRKIGESSRAICASPAYLERFGTPKTPADLAGHNCIVISGFPYLRRWPFASPEGVNLQDVGGNLVTDSAHLMVDMMLAGLGIGRLARFTMAEPLADGRLVEILKDMHRIDPFPIHAIMPPGGNRSPKVRAFVDFLAGHPLLKTAL
ncbi:LysR family transcriptional regulator [Rhizobium sp. C1]|uniref:LysR family transcriptional regulator n=1 Tax=Rhizobium sp. C1 TaxID=1349799 RepID=UPI001E36D4AC|nr:LysR family transcriptional regulator [Rhizobium sp. C1]MCD2180032.1 LysR family transcriptional regulator [Rhizobium sp. C1]